MSFRVAAGAARPSGWKSRRTSWAVFTPRFAVRKRKRTSHKQKAGSGFAIADPPLQMTKQVKNHRKADFPSGDMFNPLQFPPNFPLYPFSLMAWGAFIAQFARHRRMTESDKVHTKTAKRNFLQRCLRSVFVYQLECFLVRQQKTQKKIAFPASGWFP